MNMPKIKFNDKEAEVPEDANPYETFEKLGIDFSCHNGICGTCKMKVKEGMENINSKTEMEEEFPLSENERLACQCHKLKGDIKIEYDEW
ncbi:ferredoxin [Candidatus Pacearchaeota archaeon CG10_big_fil_rev_8_21_14_0_10_32_42]|nr:MAG: ferredoxin [Candidatus Pacearchaeota archaeon CG10_big_fil_rev_8_21_14_0_10_32_42]